MKTVSLETKPDDFSRLLLVFGRLALQVAGDADGIVVGAWTPVHFKTARNAEDITETEKSMALVDYWIIRLPLDIVELLSV